MPPCTIFYTEFVGTATVGMTIVGLTTVGMTTVGVATVGITTVGVTVGMATTVVSTVKYLHSCCEFIITGFAANSKFSNLQTCICLVQQVIWY